MLTWRLNIPIILTFSRIFLIPLFLILTPKYPIEGVIVFSIASVTDLLDGYIARKRGEVTKFGIILDPIADKFLIISALILLVDMGLVPVIVAVVIIIREFFVTALRVVALTKRLIIPAETAAKLKTATQTFAIIFLILRISIVGINFHKLGIILIWIAMFLGVFSGIRYTIYFWKVI